MGNLNWNDRCKNVEISLDIFWFYILNIRFYFNVGFSLHKLSLVKKIKSGICQKLLKQTKALNWLCGRRN